MDAFLYTISVAAPWCFAGAILIIELINAAFVRGDASRRSGWRRAVWEGLANKEIPPPGSGTHVHLDVEKLIQFLRSEAGEKALLIKPEKGS